MEISREEIVEIMSILDANTDAQLLDELDKLKEYIKNTSKKYYTARVIFKNVRRILYCDAGDYKLCAENCFYLASVRDIYYFNSIEDIIGALLKIERLPYLGRNEIEIWYNSGAGEDKLLFKIVR